MRKIATKMETLTYILAVWQRFQWDQVCQKRSWASFSRNIAGILTIAPKLRIPQYPSKLIKIELVKTVSLSPRWTSYDDYNWTYKQNKVSNKHKISIKHEIVGSRPSKSRKYVNFEPPLCEKYLSQHSTIFCAIRYGSLLYFLNFIEPKYKNWRNGLNTTKAYFWSHFFSTFNFGVEKFLNS